MAVIEGYGEMARDAAIKGQIFDLEWVNGKELTNPTQPPFFFLLLLLLSKFVGKSARCFADREILSFHSFFESKERARRSSEILWCLRNSEADRAQRCIDSPDGIHFYTPP